MFNNTLQFLLIITTFLIGACASETSTVNNNTGDTNSGNDTPTGDNILIPVNKSLIYPHNFKYLGAFRVPSGDLGYSYGGGNLTYNPNNDSLLISNFSAQVAEISIPDPVISDSISDLNVASEIQAFADPTEGNRVNIGVNGTEITDNSVRLGGILVHDNKLIGSAFHFYDGSQLAKLSHFTSSLDLDLQGDFQGMFQVGSEPDVPNAGFVSGWMANLPEPWPGYLGGDIITGNGTLSVISRTSYGPSAFAINANDLGNKDPVDAIPLFYYPSSHPNLGGYESSNPNFNGTTKIAGMIIPEDASSIIFFGYHGVGQYNYGSPSYNQPEFADICTLPDECKDGAKGYPVCADVNNCTTGRKGLPYDPECRNAGSDGCYFDPIRMGGKGPHAYPYLNQAWAYDMNDFVKVKNGEMNPWDVLPYAVWNLPIEVSQTAVFGGAAAYDPVKDRVFIVQPDSDFVGCCEKLPTIHVFGIDREAPEATSYLLSGTVLLLNGDVKLKVNNSEEITVSSTDRSEPQVFNFSTNFISGDSYEIKVSSQPDDAAQICKVYNGTGRFTSFYDVSNVIIYCSNEPIS